MLHWLIFGIPWEVQAAAALLLLGLLVFLFKVPPRWVLPIAAALAAALGYNRAAQAGWKAKAEKDMRDADKLIEKARKARQKAESIPTEKLRDSDGFRRD